MQPTQTSNMQTHRRRAIMQQTVKQGTNISSMSTHKLNKDNTLKNDQDNIPARESRLRQIRYTTI